MMTSVQFVIEGFKNINIRISLYIRILILLTKTLGWMVKNIPII